MSAAAANASGCPAAPPIVGSVAKTEKSGSRTAKRIRCKGHGSTMKAPVLFPSHSKGTFSTSWKKNVALSTPTGREDPGSFPNKSRQRTCASKAAKVARSAATANWRASAVRINSPPRSTCSRACFCPSPAFCTRSSKTVMRSSNASMPAVLVLHAACAATKSSAAFAIAATSSAARAASNTCRAEPNTSDTWVCTPSRSACAASNCDLKLANRAAATSAAFSPAAISRRP